jgi:hypothetical protein
MSSFSWVCTLNIVWKVLFFTCTNVWCLQEKKGVMCISSHEKTICANWPIEWSPCQSLGLPSFELWSVGFWCSFNSFYSFHFHISPFSPLLSPLFGLVLIFHSPYFSISLLYLFISFLLCSFQTCQNPKLFWNFKPHEPPSMEDLGFFVLLKIAKTFSLCTKTCSHTKNILDWVVSNLICMKLFTNFNVNLHSNLR